MKVVASLLRYLTLSLVAVAVLVGGLLAALQTEWLQKRVLSYLQATLTEQGLVVEASDLSGFLPFQLRLGSVRISDRQGPWLTLQEVSLDWDGWALLRGEILIRSLTAASIALARPPQIADDPADDEPLRLVLPELPPVLKQVRIQRLAVGNIALGEAFVGEPLAMSLTGGMRTLPGPELQAQLELRGKAGTDFDGSLSVRAYGRPVSVDLELRSEDRSGLVRHLVGLPGSGPVSVGLRGQGPLGLWSGRLDLSVAGIGALTSGIEFGVEPDSYIDLDGALMPEPGLWFEQIAPLLGERPTFRASLSRQGDLLEVRELFLDAPAAQLTVAGGTDLGTETLDVDVAVRVMDLAVFSKLAGTPLQGRMDLDLKATGQWLQPRLSVGLHGVDLSGFGSALASLEVESDVVPTQPLDQGFRDLRITTSGQLRGLRIDNVPDLPAVPVNWHGVASVVSPLSYQISELQVDTEGVRLTGNGQLDLQASTGQLTWALNADDLRPWFSALGSPVSPESLALQGEFRLQGSQQPITTRIQGSVAGIDGFAEQWSPLLGGKFDFSLHGGWQPGGELSVSSLRVDGEAARLSASGSARIPDGVLQADIEAVVADLQVLSEVVGAPVSGSAELVLELAGTLADPLADVTLTGTDLRYDQRVIGQLHASAILEELLRQPAADLQVSVGPADALITLSSGMVLDGSLLRLEQIELMGPDSELRGSLQVALQGPWLNGTLKGKIRDLGSLVYWHQDTGLQGAVQMEAELGSEDLTQQARLSVKATDIVAEFGTLQQLDLELRADDVYARSGLDALLRLRRYEYETVTLEQASLGVRGDAERLAMTLQVEGQLEQPLDLEAAASLEIHDQGLTLEVEKLAGNLGGRALRLLAPATVAWAPAVVELADLRLKFDEALLTANVRYAASDIAGSATLKNLPLSLVGDLAGLQLEGVGDAQLNLGGSAADPEADLLMNLREVAVPHEDIGEIPRGTIEGRVRLAAGVLRGDLSAAGITRKPLLASWEVPVQVSLAPFAFVVDASAPVKGNVSVEADLGRLSRLVELDNQALEGMLRADIGVGGSLVAPQLKGSVTLNDGRYENGEYGTVLQGIEGRLVAAGNSMRLLEFRATDGSDGRLQGSGELVLESLGLSRFEADLDLANVRLMRGDKGDLTISGLVSVSGDGAGALAQGTITVNQSEFRIPDRIDSAVLTLDVQEVYDGVPVAEEIASVSTPPYQVVLDLDIEVPGRTFIRGRGLDSEWSGQIEVQGRVDDPRLLGQLEVRRGRFDFLDRPFQIEQGVINFYGSNPPAPTITLETRAQGSDMVAIMRLEGPVEAPEFTLDSEPELPQDEVLSRLLFDRDTTELTPFEALSLASAVRTLTGQGGAGWMDQARGSVGLDRLNVSTGTEGGGSVEAGKYISEDTFFEVVTGFGSESSQLRVEKELNKSFSVETNVDQDSNSGFGINWKLDY